MFGRKPGLLAMLAAMIIFSGVGPRPKSSQADPTQDKLASLQRPVIVSPAPRQWHKVTLTLAGPEVDERQNDPNPFLDYRLTVAFRHASGEPAYTVAGYFAADGQAAETSATRGRCWRVHLSPDRPGFWHYKISMRRGKDVAIELQNAGEPVGPLDGLTGRFQVAPTDKLSTGRDLRGRGRLEYVGQHYLQFAGNGRFFFKAGADAPETLLAYRDFDGTVATKPAAPLKTWQPHVRDWRDGDPTWQRGKGKGLIGAVNYLAAAGGNAFSFLTYNAGGDGDNVWPFVQRDDKLHYDCSKLDQWQIVLDHAQSQGMFLHFKLQEQENDDNRTGSKRGSATVAAALDGGDLGRERKLYCRELVARFAHELALNWNLGEENTQTVQQQRAMAAYLHRLDPYDHPIVVHTFPDQQDVVYPPLLGNGSVLSGASLQNHWRAAHRRALKWLDQSRRAGRPWVIAQDEQNPADLGVPPDPGYRGHDGKAREKRGRTYDLHDIRKYTLWGNLMAGGAGVEYYFGYRLPENDLLCEDFRSRAQSWRYGQIAVAFFDRQHAELSELHNADALVAYGRVDTTAAAPPSDRAQPDNGPWCLARPERLYLVYLPMGGRATLDLTATEGTYHLEWFNPRTGQSVSATAPSTVSGGSRVDLGLPPDSPTEDWAIVCRRTDMDNQ